MYVIVLLVSIVIQLTAAYFAFRLIRVTGRRFAWLCIVGAMLLMAGRRMVALWYYVDAAGGVDFTFNEWLGLIISTLACLGIWRIRPYLLMVQASEQSLKVSEEVYRSIFNSTGTAMAIIEEDMTLVLVNAEFVRLSGYTREELEGKVKWTKLVSPMDLPRMKEYHIKRRENNSSVPMQYEFHFADRSGGLHFACLNIHLLPGTRRSIASIVDITERKQMEERQHALIMGLHKVVTIADELIACKDVDSLYRRAVESAREHLGVERCAIFNLKDDMVYGTYGTDMNGQTTDESGLVFKRSEKWDKWFTNWMQRDELWVVADLPYYTWRNNESVSTGHGWVAHTPIAQESTHPFAVFVNDSAIRCNPINPVLQEIIAVYCSLLANIIVRKQAEENLRNSQAKLNSILSAIQDVIIVVDADGRYLEVAPIDSASLYKPVHEIIGRRLHEIFPKEQADYFLGLVKKVITLNQSMPIEYSLIIDGTEKWFSAVLSPMIDNQVVLVARDVTDRVLQQEQERAMQSRLVRAERMESLGLLAGGVAHDLNNLLGPIVAYPDLILMRLPEDTPIRSDLMTMQEAAKRSAAIIQDLLVLSRRSTCCVAPVMLNEVIHSYQESASFRDLKERFPNVTFTLDIEQKPLMVQGSISHLTQVIMNLVINAYEVIKGEGRVTVTCRHISLDACYDGFEPIPKGQYCMLTVSDTGPGIKREDIEHIFEPFFSKKKMGQSGTGLGLAVVYGVVKDMNGYIDVFGQVGSGAEFSIYLPISEESCTEVRHDKLEEYTGNESILMLDDEPSQREVARRLLERMGYRIHTCARFKDALSYFKEHKVDLVILDMILGGHYDGLDVYRELRNIDEHVKCIIVSGFSASDRVKTAQNEGAGLFIQKPYTASDIGRAVRRTLDGVALG